MAKILELNDYKLYNKENYNKDTKCYAIFSGEQSIEEKIDILKTVNSEENKHGDIINILLISVGSTLFIFLLSLIIFHRREDSFVDHL